MSKYLVVYSSETGNTKMVADEIYSAIHDSDKEILNIRQWNGTHVAETYFIGFWANRGSCSLEIIDLLSSLHGKNVALFGTCGMGNSPEYFSALECTVAAWLASDNKLLGSYLCQGKMPVQVRAKYEGCRGKMPDDRLDCMIRNFDEALKHPDKQDLLRANVFTDEMIKKI